MFLLGGCDFAQQNRGSVRAEMMTMKLALQPTRGMLVA
jgi:hypothetical protein